MTPIIDVVFLLIIFFLVVCQFIEAENLPVDVPDGCEFAESEKAPVAATITVMKTTQQGCCFAVGAEKITASNHSDIIEALTRLIDTRLAELPVSQRVVTLRIDKDICFDQAQYALAAVAASGATNVQLAVLKR